MASDFLQWLQKMKKIKASKNEFKKQGKNEQESM